MQLSDFFEQNPRGAVAYSGGVDSSLLVWAAMKYGRDWCACYIHPAFQPTCELEDCQERRHSMQNAPNRYYYCFGVVQNNTGSCGGQVNEFLNMCG